MTTGEIEMVENELRFIRLLVIIVRPIRKCKDRKGDRKDASGKDVNFLGTKLPGVHPHLELVTHSGGSW